MLQEYKQIDANGEILEGFVYDSDIPEEIPADCVPMWPRTERYFNPVYNRDLKQWEERVTAEQLEAEKEKVKAGKKDIFSKSCRDEITAGFDCKLAGVTYHFGYGLEDQINLQDCYTMFEHGAVTSVTLSAYVDGEKFRLPLNKADFTTVYLAGVKHKQDTLAYFNDTLAGQLEEAVTLEEVKAVTWRGEPETPSLNLPDQALLNGVWNQPEKKDKKDNPETSENTL